ncbi:hypothetical protein GQX74_015513 [Glossina fuscipes]|nr:hypothetical protein GQX74_015513 [Glossina fuscipes]
MPLIAAILADYNWSVFAYGQTGAGNTHIIVGKECDQSKSTGDDDHDFDYDIVIMSRALVHFFDGLHVLEFVGLNTKTLIFHDSTKKDSAIIQALERYHTMKLTHTPQELMGGRTKSSIIAIISSSHKDIDKILSTSEYACRVKNTHNKTEFSQKLATDTLCNLRRYPIYRPITHSLYLRCRLEHKRSDYHQAVTMPELSDRMPWKDGKHQLYSVEYRKIVLIS